MVDANIIISAILFPTSVVAKAFTLIIKHYNLVLSKYTANEIDDVFIEKFPHKIKEKDIFMRNLIYELFDLDTIEKNKYPEIRDIDDLPVLANAIESKVDILLTGDKDFDEIQIDKPIIMKPRPFLDQYNKIE
jgi:putative PIN family toxin of toxin-antitoxin system